MNMMFEKSNEKWLAVKIWSFMQSHSMFAVWGLLGSDFYSNIELFHHYDFKMLSICLFLALPPDMKI